MKVAYTVPNDGACTYYRVMLPMQTARKYGVLGAMPIFKSDDPARTVKIVGESDLVVCQRVSEEVFLKVIDAYHKDGKKVVMDWDDDVFNVSPFNPFYEELGTENFSTEINGKKIDVWKDGVNFSIEHNKKSLDAVKKVCSAVDMVTVTTENLANVYRQFNDSVTVLPNCVEINRWQKLNLMPHMGVRIGWFGGSSHYEDWCMIAPVIREILFKYPMAMLVLMGVKFDGTLKGIPQKQIEFHDWDHTQAYPYKAAILDLDLAVIPLEHTVFNQSKSPIKWIEMAALKVPAVTSYVPPYDAVMDLVPDNGIFIDNNNLNGWFLGIEKLIEDSRLRETMGLAAYKTVLDHFDINTQYSLWANAYKETMVCQRRQTQHSTN